MARPPPHPNIYLIISKQLKNHTHEKDQSQFNIRHIDNRHRRNRISKNSRIHVRGSKRVYVFRGGDFYRGNNCSANCTNEKAMTWCGEGYLCEM